MGAAAGCGSNDPTEGVLVIPFKLGNGKTCEAVNVETVRAELDDGYMDEEVDCIDGEVRIDRVPEGHYDVKLYGISNGFPVMDSLGGSKVVAHVVAGITTTVEPAVVLTAAPAKLQVRWDLGYGNCDGSDFSKFHISAWETNGVDLLLDATLDCSAAGEGTLQYRTVADPDRELSGDLLGEVTIQPIDGSGAEKGDPVVFTFDPPGAGHPVRLSIDCSSSSECTGSGMPD